MILIVSSFALCYIAAGVVDLLKERRRHSLYLLYSLSIILIIISGVRSFSWPDTPQYELAFKTEIKGLTEAFKYGAVTTYSEPGFIYLSRVVKTFTNSVRIYFFLISFISSSLIAIYLKKFCVFPVIGLLVYVSRFFISRNMMQIRAALAIAIVIFAIKFIYDRNLRKFLGVVLIATFIHFSCIIVIPLYWLCEKSLSTKKAFAMCTLGIVSILLITPIVQSKVILFNNLIGMNSTYIGGDESYSEGMGIKNPMIYYQMLVLYLWCISESSLIQKIKYYHIIKWWYLFSTMILILLSPFLVLSGRLSTITATIEILMIPALIAAPRNKDKKLATFVVYGVLITSFLFLNLKKVQYIL